uniref:Uncharacterized protein n=1 Tax=Cacopsylla melanoneura TaxID=428564 RepID=A0A8D8YFJ2_9HEMI
MDGMIPPNPHLKPLEYLNPEPVAPEYSVREYYERFALELEEQDWTPDPTPTYSYVWNQHNMRHHSLIPPLSCIQSCTNIPSHHPQQMNRGTTNQRTAEQTTPAAVTTMQTTAITVNL